MSSISSKKRVKQVDLRCHSSKVEFICSYFGGNVYLKKSFQLFLTFSNQFLSDDRTLQGRWQLLKFGWTSTAYDGFAGGQIGVTNPFFTKYWMGKWPLFLSNSIGLALDSVIHTD